MKIPVTITISEDAIDTDEVRDFIIALMEKIAGIKEVLETKDQGARENPDLDEYIKAQEQGHKGSDDDCTNCELWRERNVSGTKAQGPKVGTQMPKDWINLAKVKCQCVSCTVLRQEIEGLEDSLKNHNP